MKQPDLEPDIKTGAPQASAVASHSLMAPGSCKANLSWTLQWLDHAQKQVAAAWRGLGPGLGGWGR